MDIRGLTRQQCALPVYLAAICILFLLCPTYVEAADRPPAPGTVTAWGSNSSGQLGDGATFAQAGTPVSVYLPAGVTASAISAGYFHNLALTNDGVYFWGAAANGVAVPSATKVLFPAAVVSVSAIAAGGGHDLAITNDGLYAWGSNSSGQVGDGTNTDQPAPVKVVFPSTVTRVSAVAAGAYHSLAITNDGIYAWGANAGGQLGDGTRINRSAPVKVALPPWNPIATAIAGGGYHSLAITEDGVYTWGNNTFGQLGDGSTRDSLTPELIHFQPPVLGFTAIAAGFWHTLAATNDGLYGFGFNGNGELGDGSFASRALPVRTAMPKAVTVIKSIGAGAMHSLAATDQGAYAWGNNSSGQLGVGSTNKQNVPNKIRSEVNAIAVSAGYYHSLALH